jgi:hypothetical protein
MRNPRRKRGAELNREKSMDSHRPSGFWSLTLLLVSAVLLASLVPATSATADLQVAPVGPGGGEVLIPSALAVDSDGSLVVADQGNRRVDVFGSNQEFLRAFGWGVVATGPNNDPRNEKEQLEVAATGGSFTLLFVQNGEESIGVIKQETGLIPFDATASAIQAALEDLPALEPGDVVVTGPTSGPWTIEFTGNLADMDVHELEEGDSSELTGGAAELNISTLQDGANYEICETNTGEECRPGQRGVKAGQLNPSSVAVDPITHDVYVFDGFDTPGYNEDPNLRVQKFTSEGEFIYMLGGGVNLDTGEDICTAASGDTCGRGDEGTGAGEFNSERSSVAVGPGGVLYVNDGGRVQKFDSTGALIGEISLSGVIPNFLAVDSSGNIYAGTFNEVGKYTPTGTLLYSLPASNVGGIAVDASDRLYVSDLSSGEFGMARYSSMGTLEKVFYSLTGERAVAIAPSKEEDAVFTVEGEGLNSFLREVNLIPIPLAGPVVYPDPDSLFAGPIGNVRATLNARINPEGKATTFHFEYVEQAAFESEGGWSSPKVQETAESGTIGSDFTLHDVEALIGCADAQTEAAKCLIPQTKYRFRVVASNADGVTEGPDAEFETEPPVKFGPLSTTEVTTDSATLNVELNPLGFETEGFFEYVDDAAYQASGFATATKAPATAIDFGGGEAFVEASASISGLTDGTTYHFRVVATNNCKPAEPTAVCTSTSPEETFKTFEANPPPPSCPANEALRSAASRLLLDCRAYEMVSPVDKNGVNIEVVFNNAGYPAELNQSGIDGDKISYSAYRAFAEPKSSPYTSQYLAERLSEGWQTEHISPPREGPSLYNVAGLDLQFKAFADDLCAGWPLQDTALLLTPDAVADFPNLYKRDNCEPEAGSYEAITTVAPIGGGVEPKNLFLELQGFSQEGDKTFFAVAAKLTSNSRKGITQVYESSVGGIKPVCVLPEGSTTLSGCSIGTGSALGDRNLNVATGVSEDGSIVYWTNAPTGPGALYARINMSETVQVSGQASQFWAAAADGSKALYTVGEKLFEFDLASKASAEIAGGVKGVAGASKDVSHFYFVSMNDLAGEAVEGQPNLYLRASGTTTFIGTLANEDLPPPSNRPSLISARPLLRLSRVTPDGERLVFMSRASLTGYDNRDAVTDEPASEVFLYDATAEGGAGKLRCVSCNPSGARPVGQNWSIAGIVGGRTAAFIPAWATQLYASRVISDDGSRVFFNSFDALVARDTNNAQDVYEWEAPGTGNCTEGGYAYVAAAEGCVNLISTGSDEQASEFVDASASGNDVFFKTYSSLVPYDPANVDIYDARVDGGFPNPPPPPIEPEGEAGMAPPKPEPAHPTPQSQSFVGPGNQVAKPKPKPKCPKGKHRVKRKGKFVCVKNKKGGKKQSKQNKTGRAGK